MSKKEDLLIRRSLVLNDLQDVTIDNELRVSMLLTDRGIKMLETCDFIAIDAFFSNIPKSATQCVMIDAVVSVLSAYHSYLPLHTARWFLHSVCVCSYCKKDAKCLRHYFRRSS